MGCRWIYSMPVRTLLLIVGVALITLGITEGKSILSSTYKCNFLGADNKQ